MFELPYIVNPNEISTVTPQHSHTKLLLPPKILKNLFLVFKNTVEYHNHKKRCAPLYCKGLYICEVSLDLPSCPLIKLTEWHANCKLWKFGDNCIYFRIRNLVQNFLVLSHTLHKLPGGVCFWPEVHTQFSQSAIDIMYIVVISFLFIFTICLANSLFCDFPAYEI